MSNFMSVFEDLDRIYEEDLQQEVKTELTEEVEEVLEPEVEEVEEVETPAEETDMTDDAPVEEAVDLQFVLECAKCGAIALKAGDEVIYDEASDLVNVEETCQYCEATEGFKILGNLTPIEAAEDEEVNVDIAEDEVVEEGLFGKKVEKKVKVTDLKKGDILIADDRDEKYPRPLKVIKNLGKNQAGNISIDFDGGNADFLPDSEVTILTKE